MSCSLSTIVPIFQWFGSCVPEIFLRSIKSQFNSVKINIGDNYFILRCFFSVILENLFFCYFDPYRFDCNFIEWLIMNSNMNFFAIFNQTSSFKIIDTSHRYLYAFDFVPNSKSFQRFLCCFFVVVADDKVQ